MGPPIVRTLDHQGMLSRCLEALSTEVEMRGSGVGDALVKVVEGKPVLKFTVAVFIPGVISSLSAIFVTASIFSGKTGFPVSCVHLINDKSKLTTFETSALQKPCAFFRNCIVALFSSSMLIPLFLPPRHLMHSKIDVCTLPVSRGSRIL